MDKSIDFDDRGEELWKRTHKIQFALLIGTSALTACASGVLGPALPDLICITNTDLKFASTIFLSYWSGQCCTCILGIFVQDKVDVSMTMTMTITLVLYAFLTASLPLIKFLPVSDVIHFLVGGCCGILQTGCYVQINTVCWMGNIGFHMLTASAALGSVIIPLITGLFANHHHLHDGDEHKNSTLAGVKDACNGFSTNIEYVFLLLSLASLCLAVGFAINYPEMRNYHNSCQPKVNDIAQSKSESRELVIFKILLLSVLGILGAGQITLTSLIVTYGVRSNLHLSVGTGTLLTSIFNLCLLVSRVINAAFANRVRPDGMFWFTSIFCLCIALYFVLCKTLSTTLSIVCILFGIGFGPQSPCLLSWSKCYLTFTVRFVSLLFVFISAGNLVHPTISGILMDFYGPDMLVYSVSVTCILQILLFGVLWARTRNLGQPDD